MPTDPVHRARQLNSSMRRVPVSRLVPATHRRVGRLIRQGSDWRAIARRLAPENADLQVQLGAQLDEVLQSRTRLVEDADNERRRLERDLHDGAQQQLVTVLLWLQLAKAEALQRSDPNTAHMLDQSIESLRQALDELRSLARGIHPTILQEAGVAPAIRTLAERCPIPVEVTGGLERLEPRPEAALCFFSGDARTHTRQDFRGTTL